MNVKRDRNRIESGGEMTVLVTCVCSVGHNGPGGSSLRENYRVMLEL